MISIRGAGEHNLKGVDLDIPRGSLTVVTGVSGSGKSSLAFDTICAEGRRRYLETFSSYARQFLGRLSHPAVTRIDGLSPAVALDQSTTCGSPRSTVGTLSEIYDLLRLLWARAGIASVGAEGVKVERALFSFNSPAGACPRCKGLGVEDSLDPDLLVADPAKTVREGALRITTPTGYVIYSQVTLDVLDQVCRAHGFSLDVSWQALTADQRDVILNGSDRIRIPYGKHPLASRLRWKGITAKPREEGVYKGILPVMEQILRTKRNRNILRFVRSMPCRACGGTRLRPEALAVMWRGLTIAQAASLSIDRLDRLFENETEVRKRAGPLDNATVKVEAAVAEQVVARCEALQALGLGYVTLDRTSTTLSAGEMQRIRLARLAGIGLAGVLYVLDEPSVGLHHRDIGQLLGVLRRIRDRGNTVLVVEHDEQTIRAADWIVDIGPAAGAAGGEVLYSGPATAFTSQTTADMTPGLRASRTHAFLTGDERIPVPARRRDGSGTLRVSGITKHNLRDVSVQFKLGALNVVSGVAGAGKSTLVEETARVLSGGMRVRASTRSARTAVSGGSAPTAESNSPDKIIAIDQAPIGRTPRSNPATYTGLFDVVRALFAAQPEARRRGFGKGRFSFNVRGGRCEACEGAGVQQIGMHFLGTVSIVCEACGGRRFNDETLEVEYLGRNIHDVLAMPLDRAAAFFADQPLIARTLDPMCALGLGYLALGHPATMLSGGEAQRVKLATELARPGTGRTLYLLDEPTTGLHPADVALLLSALEKLVAKGNTVVAVEHDLDVIKVADWIVDLGPGSGAAGGRVVAMGTPETIAASQASVTGAALLGSLNIAGAEASRRERTGAAQEFGPARRRVAPIRFVNVSTHNLQHLDIEIPAHQLTVITGVSGSGKSSLAFDTIFAEGQQRFSESFSTYGRRFLNRSSEAEFDQVSGLTPTIAISQGAPSRNPRSTVGTLTEIQDYYRLLFARAGTRFCPACDVALLGVRSETVAFFTPDPGARREKSDSLRPDPECPLCGFHGARTLAASMFSPNSEQGACPRCRGLGFVLDCDPAKLVTDPSRPLAGGAMVGHKSGRFYGDPNGQHMAILAAVGRALRIDFARPWQALDEHARAIALRGAGERVFDVEWKYVRGNRSGVHSFPSKWPGLLACVREEYERKHADRRGEAMEVLMTPVACTDCGGGKLKQEFLHVRFAGVGIHQLLAKSVEDSVGFFHAIESGERVPAAERPTAAARQATSELRSDVVGRLVRLRDAGLGYLTLDRPATSLSGGEAQRVRLATALGAGLTGITYVLDEPTIGLHARDTARLVALLRDLRDAGNTVIVVEHDRDVIAAADYVVEMGPGAGAQGGRLIAQGTPADVRNMPSSRTARLLSHPRSLARRSPGRPLVPGIAIRGAAVHNLHALDIDIPAGGLVCITGVSGSGKSTLVFDVLAPSAEGGAPINCRAFAMRTPFRSTARVEQTSAGRSPWSNAATHTGVFDEIRELFAGSAAARARGLQKKHFSTHAPGGRCETCDGLGEVRTAMDFLPDVWMTCEECHGKRYANQVLECLIDGRSIADVLEMTVDGAREFLKRAGARHAVSSRAVTALDLLAEVGLGYVRLGQPARTLSGGERQRLVLATGLLRPHEGATLYLFDEPTTGLHADDVDHMLRVFDRLIDAGHTLVVIEHNLDVVAKADWVIDLGPEGGNAGGGLVAAGAPDVIAANPQSHTGRALRAGCPASGA